MKNRFHHMVLCDFPCCAPAKQMFSGVYWNKPVCLSIHMSVCVQNTCFHQSTGGGVKWHLVRALVEIGEIHLVRALVEIGEIHLVRALVEIGEIHLVRALVEIGEIHFRSVHIL